MSVVTRRDELKSQIHEVTVTLGDGSQLPEKLPGEVLRQRRRARQWQLLVKGQEDPAISLHGQAGIEHVEVRVPSLEEIFVAYVAPPSQEADVTATQQEVTP